MKKPDDIKQEIEKLVDEYQISHKGSAQCKCISGARGHLIAKLMTLADRIREDERERIVEEYGDYRLIKKFGLLNIVKYGKTLRFYLSPHTKHKVGDDDYTF